MYNKLILPERTVNCANAFSHFQKFLFLHWCCECESRSGWGVQHYVIKWFTTGWWFSPGPPVSSTNKTDCHDIAEILLKVALNTIKQTNIYTWNYREGTVLQVTRCSWYTCLLSQFSTKMTKKIINIQINGKYEI